MKFTGDKKRLLLFVMSSCCVIFGSLTLIFKEKIFATILHSVSQWFYLHENFYFAINGIVYKKYHANTAPIHLQYYKWKKIRIDVPWKYLTVSILAATHNQGGYGSLQCLGRDPHPRLHQVLLLWHAQPPWPFPQPREADPGGERPLRV